ncbi:hypothetical protein PENSPDRAFT_691378 [Peniophora sp. CONT]|nr:hypothetical protein PENSPDRAFT_670692 [Peniophora sp. CONT]KZV63711.1 hypothetical protein PENSPDRAFT_691378 [Peniophora sp. CONT]
MSSRARNREANSTTNSHPSSNTRASQKRQREQDLPGTVVVQGRTRPADGRRPTTKVQDNLVDENAALRQQVATLQAQSGRRRKRENRQAGLRIDLDEDENEYEEEEIDPEHGGAFTSDISSKGTYRRESPPPKRLRRAGEPVEQGWFQQQAQGSARDRTPYDGEDDVGQQAGHGADEMSGFSPMQGADTDELPGDRPNSEYANVGADVDADVDADAYAEQDALNAAKPAPPYAPGIQPGKADKASDFEAPVKHMLLTATRFFEARQVSQHGIPDFTQQMSYAAASWTDAERLHEAAFKLTNDMASLIKARHSNVRNDLLTVTRNVLVRLFKFEHTSPPPGNARGPQLDLHKQAVEANKQKYWELRADDRFAYDEVDENGEPVGIAQHPSILEIITQRWFLAGTSIGTIAPSFFNPIRLETLALILAILEHALEEWKNGMFESIVLIAGNTLKTNYQKHLSRLEDWRNLLPAAAKKWCQSLFDAAYFAAEGHMYGEEPAHGLDESAKARELARLERLNQEFD